MRDILSLMCTVCQEKNYYTTKNKKKKQDKIELKKYCSRCRKHVLHKEGKA